MFQMLSTAKFAVEGLTIDTSWLYPTHPFTSSAEIRGIVSEFAEQ